MTVPFIFATHVAGNVPASQLDDNFAYLITDLIDPSAAVTIEAYGGSSAASGASNAIAFNLAKLDGRYIAFDGRKSYNMAAVTVSATDPCAGMVSLNGTSTIVPSGTTSADTFVKSLKGDFTVDHLHFNGPVSTNPANGQGPACAVSLWLEPTAPASTSRLRVTNCRFTGSINAIYCPTAAIDCLVAHNTFYQTWATATIFFIPRNMLFHGNKAESCGYNAALTDSVHHFTTEFSTGLAENLIVSSNIVRDCNVGLQQEAFDQYGHNIRNAVYSNNIIDNVGGGGFEFKSDPSAGAGGFYGDVSITGNIINFVPGSTGVGVALNGNNVGGPVADNKFKRFKISDNQFVSDGAGASSVVGITVGPYNNVDISNNQFQNIGDAIYISPAYSVSETATAISIRSNVIDALATGILSDTGRTITGLEIIGNDITAVGPTVNLAGATINNLVMIGNYHTTSASTYIAGFGNIQIGKIERDIFVASNTGVIFAGTASTAVRVIGCDVTTAAGEAFRVDTGTILFQDNSASIPEAAPIVNATGGTVTSVNNRRNGATSNPSGVVAAGAVLGEIVPNTAPGLGLPAGWISVVTGTGGGGGSSVFQPLDRVGNVPTAVTGVSATVADSDQTIIANRAGTVTLTLSTAAYQKGRRLRVVTIQAQTVISAGSNVVPLAGGAAGTAILAATAGKWADLEMDGSTWTITASN